MQDWSNSGKLPERLPFSKKRLPKRVIFSYIFDYVIIVVLIVAFYIVDKIPPFYQPFSLDNYTLWYPYADPERIPVFQLCLICVAAPAAIIAFYTLVIDGLFSHQTPMPAGAHGLRKLSGRYRLKDRLWELNCGILGLGVAVGAAFTITGALKNAIGKPRPDLIHRCNLNMDMVKAIADRTLATVKFCQEEDKAKLNDGFKSFPSGHSSTAFAGLFYLSLYLAAKLHVLDSKGEVWKAFIVLVPTLGACLVAGSRIMDARHHPFDVLFGSAMGILVAWGSYRQYFPPVSETWRKGRAYPIRAWGRQPIAPEQLTTRIDEDVEPLRPLRREPTDVEDRAAASGFSAQATAGAGSTSPGVNVFREQISQSQRRRQDDGQPYGIQHTDTLASTMSTKVARYQGQMPGPNPFASDSVRRQDNYDYSSSDEDDNYELQQRYGRSTTQTAGASYNQVDGRLTDTGYHPPSGISPHPTPPPHAGDRPFQTTGPTGDLADAPSAPPHSIGTAA
ncbi:PAP2-domain-containing protein [Aaosphaeria arxii CBS 175.79]|uniref:PAP2-domain-containing protein n=1 Tax=Aaosphaeria arxii CBS 175.79 TaxID=1450172 RepID=A0A6A5Y903_9PLEO|nr:PAP2-domain-containing protein [Aaosphaeria arxii CBS 175.79]KAF2022065.1 PAP2-domain-containing protein [Aaosphaeria arxii CBS 175.79]